MKRYITLLLILLFSTIFANAKNRILIISSFSQNHKWTNEVCNKVYNDSIEKKNKYIVDVLNLNAANVDSSIFEGKFKSFVPMIKDGKYDMIICLLKPAEDLLLESYNNIPKNTSIIFIGYIRSPEELKLSYPNITGFYVEYDFEKMFELMHILYPEIKEYAIVSDSWDSGISIKNAISNYELESDIKLVNINAITYSTEAMIDRLSEMPRNSLLLFTPWRTFSKDAYVSLTSVADDLVKYLSHPYFITNDMLFGHGALGGLISRGESQGNSLVKLINRILDGDNVIDIPFQAIPTEYVFDAKKLNSEHINISQLPQDSIIINSENDIKFKIEDFIILEYSIIFIISGLIILTIFLCLKIFKNKNNVRKKIIQLLQKVDLLSNVQCILSNSKDACVIVADSNGYISFVNNATQNLFSMNKMDLFGRNINEVFALFDSGGILTHPSIFDYAMQSLKVVHIPNRTNLKINNSFFEVTGTVFPISNIEKAHLGAILIFKKASYDTSCSSENASIIDTFSLAAEISDITFNEIDINGVISDNKYVEVFNGNRKNWGYENNKPLTPEQWIHPDDLVDFKSKFERLHKGLENKICINYKSCYKGQIRYYKLFAKVIEDSSMISRRYSCVIKDITKNITQTKLLNNFDDIKSYILDRSKMIFAVKDAEDQFKYIYTNNQFSKLLGVESIEAIGKTDFEIFEYARALLFNKNDLLSFNTKKSEIYKVEIPIIGSENKVFEITETYFKTQNRHQYIAFIGKDITNIEELREARIADKELYESILNNIPLGIYLKDPNNDLNYTMWNNAMQEYTNVPAANVIGRTFIDKTVSFYNIDANKNCDADVLENNSVNETIETITINQISKNFVLTKRPLILNEKKSYLLCTLKDITQIKETEQELKRTSQCLKSTQKIENIYNQYLNAIFSEANSNRVILNSIDIMGESSGADKSFIICTNNKKDINNKSYEWNRSGIDAKLEYWENIPLDTLPSVAAAIQRNQSIYINAIDSNVEVFNELKIFAGNNFDAKEMILHGIFIDDKLYGIMGLIYINKTISYPDKYKQVLNNCVRMYVIAIKHIQQKFNLDKAVYIRKMIFDKVNIPILLFTPDLKLCNINNAASNIINKNENEILASPCYTNYCGHNCPPDNCPVKAVLKTKNPQSTHLTFKDRKMLIHAEPILNDDGEIQYIIESAIDLTDVNESNAKLKDALLKLQIANEAKTNFISTMNHELRTPLNAVIGYSELLQINDITENERIEYLNSIKTSEKLLLKLIDDILEMTKSSSDSVYYDISHLCDLPQLIHEISSNFETALAFKNLNYKVRIEKILPQIYINEKALKRILTNILDNSVKFTSLGQIVIAVVLSKDSECKCNLRIEVEDTGIGISKNFLPRIFEPFTQDEDVRNSRAYQGSGLGLSGAKKLVDEMGGTITVNSYENIGTTVILEFSNLTYKI